jgi:hypothetical protein
VFAASSDPSPFCCVQMPINPLSELIIGNLDWTVHVYVSRLWQHRGGTDVGPIKHTDIVFQDTEVLTCLLLFLLFYLSCCFLFTCHYLSVLGDSHVWGDRFDLS